MAQKGTKIMAILALIGIIVSVVGTGILYYIESNKQTKKTPEELQKIIDTSDIQVKTEESKTPKEVKETNTERQKEENTVKQETSETKKDSKDTKETSKEEK